MHVLLTFAMLASAAAAAAPAGATARYTVLAQGKPAGTLATTIAGPGTATVRFSYRDNGRGPDLDEELVAGPNGALVRYRGKGTSTFGGPIDDSFELRGGKAAWRSTVDAGTRDVSGPRVYVPVESSPEMLAVVVRGALAQPGHRIEALPDGTLSVERLLEETVRVGGRPRRIALYAIAGADVEPLYVWMSAPDRRLFAWIYPAWLQIIEAGAEALAPSLEQRQIAATTAQLRSISRRVRHELAEPIVIRNARVFDAEHATLGQAQDIYVRNGRIASVYPAGSVAQAPGTVIDAAGRVVLPGLFDMHAHLTQWDGLRDVAAGVTTVRDLGNDNAVLAELAARIARGDAVGPRVVPAGFVEGQSEFSARNGIVVSDLDGVKRAIDWYAQRGYPQIKIYNSFHPEWVPAATAYAHERGLRVSGHVPAFMRAEDAVRQGFDEIQHVNQVMLNFFVKPTDDTRTLARFYLVAENAHALDLDSPAVRDFVALLREHGTVIDPTLTAFEAGFTQRPGEPNPSFGMVAAHLPPVARRTLLANSMNVTADKVERYRASYAKMVEFMGRLHRAGVPLVAGTDALAGFSLHRELELYVQAGIPAAEALRIATWNGAKYTRTLERLGSIAPGKAADLVLLEADPTADISAVRRPSLVMKEGVVFYPAELYEAMGIQPFAPAVAAHAP